MRDKHVPLRKTSGAKPLSRSLTFERLEDRRMLAVSYWDSANGGNWDNAALWDPGVPSANDDAYFNLLENGTVTFSSNKTVDSLSVSGNYFNGTAHVLFDLNGKKLTTSEFVHGDGEIGGELTITDGTLQVNGHAYAKNGLVDVQSGGRFNVTGSYKGVSGDYFAEQQTQLDIRGGGIATLGSVYLNNTNGGDIDVTGGVLNSGYAVFGSSLAYAYPAHPPSVVYLSGNTSVWNNSSHIVLYGGQAFNGGYNYADLRILNGATVKAAGEVYTSSYGRVYLNGGTLEAQKLSGFLGRPDQLFWDSGNLRLADQYFSSFTVPENATLTALASGQIWVGGQLDVAGNTSTLEARAGAALYASKINATDGVSLITGDGGVIGLYSINAGTGTVQLSGSGTVYATGIGGDSFQLDGSTFWVKNGSVNNFSTTGGRIVLTGGKMYAQNPVTVSDAELTGKGEFSAHVELSGTAELAPGEPKFDGITKEAYFSEPSFAKLTIGDLTLSAGTTTKIEVGGTLPSLHDTVQVKGALDLVAGSVLEVSGDFVLPEQDYFEIPIIQISGSTPANGTFAGLSEGAVVSTTLGGPGIETRISYVGGDGNDIVLQMAPANLKHTFSLGSDNVLAEGESRTVHVRLLKPPTSDVVIDLAVSDPAQATFSQTQLTFTPQDYNTAQRVTLEALDDLLWDGDTTVSLTASVNAGLSDNDFDSAPNVVKSLEILDIEASKFRTDFQYVESLFAAQLFGAGLAMGSSLALDGDFAVVGAPSAEIGSLVNAGAVFIYQRDDQGTPANTTDDTWDYVTQLLAPNPQNQAYFGDTVAIEGDTLVIGSYREDGVGTDSGRIYVFEQTLGAWEFSQAIDPPVGTVYAGFRIGLDGDTLVASTSSNKALVYTRATGSWTLQQELITSDAFAGNFGARVSLSGNTIAVGSAGDDEAGTNAGAIYLFEYDNSGSTWNETTKLLSGTPAEKEQFGYQLSLDGDVLAATKYRYDGNLLLGSSVEVFRRTADTWLYNGNLLPSENDKSMNGVEVQGNTIVFGSESQTVDGNALQGKAWVYAFNGASWTLQQDLVGSNTLANSRFGRAVAIDGDTILASAPNLTVSAVSEGAIYSYANVSNAWIELESKLLVVDNGLVVRPGGGTDFANSNALAVDGEYAVFGDSKANVDGFGTYGTAYVYKKNDNGTPLNTNDDTWEFHGRLVADDATVNMYFGESVAISGDTIAIGAKGFDHISYTDPGAVYIFSLLSGEWVQTQKIVAPTTLASDLFGIALAFHGNTLAVGAGKGGTANPSRLHIFERIADSFLYAETLDIEAIANQKRVTSVDLTSSNLAVGVELNNSTIIFERTQTGWQQSTVIYDPNGTQNGFGRSVAIDGATLVVGARDDGNGSISIFENVGGVWTHVDTLTNSDAQGNDRFGNDVAIERDMIVAGTFRNATGTRGAYVFRRENGIWAEQEILPKQGPGIDRFVNSVALQGKTIFLGTQVGAPGSSLPQVLVFNATSRFSYDATANQAITSFVLKVVNGQILLVDRNDANNILGSQALAGVNEIVIQGQDGVDDLFELDLSAGAFPTAVTFHGGVGGNDTVQIVGAGIDSVTQTFSNASDGSTVLFPSGSTQSLTVNWTGLEPFLLDVGSPANFVFQLPNGVIDLVIEDPDGNSTGMMQIRSPSGDFETTMFSNPTNTIEIRGFGTDDALSIQSFDPGFVGSLVIAPIIAVDQPMVSINEGQTATISGSYFDPDDDMLQISVSLGDVLDNGDGTWSWSYLAADDLPTTVVTVSISDEDGSLSTASFHLRVANLPPTLMLDYESVTVYPGLVAINSGTFGNLAVDTVSLAASQGTIVDNGGGAWTWSLDTSILIPKTALIFLTATDDDGASIQKSFELIVDEILAGDFDFNGGVDGADFLAWQRGSSPSPVSSLDLDDWASNYNSNATSSTTALVSAVSDAPAHSPNLEDVQVLLGEELVDVVLSMKWQSDSNEFDEEKEESATLFEERIAYFDVDLGAYVFDLPNNIQGRTEKAKARTASLDETDEPWLESSLLESIFN